MTEQPDETTEATEDVKPVPRTVRVPTTRCAGGEFADYIDCTSEAAAGWDARRWVRVR